MGGSGDETGVEGSVDAAGQSQATTSRLLRADLRPCARGNETIESQEINDRLSLLFTEVFRWEFQSG